jgi:hypothetical protein
VVQATGQSSPGYCTTPDYCTVYQVVEELVEGGTGHRTELTCLVHNT